MEPWVPPPEFGADGSAPPAKSEPVREAVDFVTIKGRLPESALTWRLRNTLSVELTGDRDLLPALWTLQDTKDEEDVILRRVEVFWLWQRQSEVRQLPPGASSKTTLRRKIGASRSIVNELSSTLGFKIGGDAVNLTGQLGSKLTDTLSLTEEYEQTEELTLVNPSTSSYRRFAIWQEAKMVIVSGLVNAEEGLAFSHIGNPIIYLAPSGATVTFKDL